MKQNNRMFNITSDWLSGFTQSDGSFVVSFQKQKIGIPVRPVPIFNITQSINEYDLFLEIQKYLNVGKIYKNRNNVTYVVKSINDIVTVIIPLFEKYPVRGSKFLAYSIFKEVALMVKNKKHLTIEGTIEIINLAYFMNKDTSLRSELTRDDCMNKLKLNYFSAKASVVPKIETLAFNGIPLVDTTKICTSSTPFYYNFNNKNKKRSSAGGEESPLNLEFVRGLIDGDGSFNISFRTTKRRIGVSFTVVSELSSVSVLNELVNFFNCGTVYKLPSNAARYQVQTVDEMLNNILPKFKNIKFNTLKQNHFNITIKVCELIKNIGYKTNKDLKTIIDLAWDMNKAGVNRKISKEEYLALFNII